MIKLILTTGRQHIFSRFVRRFTIVHSYGTKAGQYEDLNRASFDFNHASFQKATFYLHNYVQRLPYKDSKCIPNDKILLSVSDVEELQSCQSCVEAYKSILSEDCRINAVKVNILDAIQKKIWNFHIIDLDFEQSFELIERSILRKYPCEHLIRALFIRATEKFEVYDWDATSITRLMLIPIVYRDVPRALMRKVHAFVCLNLKLFSLKDLTVIVNAFYIGKFNYDNTDFLTSAALYKAQENLGSMGNGQLSILLKVCHFRRVSNIAALSGIAKDLMKDEEVLKNNCRNFMDVSQLLKQYAKAKLDVPEFVTAVLSVMPKPEIVNMQLSNDVGIFKLGEDQARYAVRLKDIGTLSWALGSMTYDIDNRTGVHSYLSELFTAIYNPGNRMDHRTLKDFFFGQVVAGRFTPVFFNYMKDTITQQLFEESKNKYTAKPRGVLTILLRVSMDIECPEVKLPELPRGLMEMQMKTNTAVFDHLQLKRITNRLNEMLQERLIVMHTILPYIPLLAEIRLDENNRPVSFKPTTYEGLLEEMKNKKLMLRKGRRIVLLLSNKGNYMLSAGDITNSDLGRPTGMNLLAKRHLQKLGYECFMIYNELIPYDAMPKYVLKQLVFEFGVELDTETIRRYRIYQDLRTKATEKG
ncbi:uncharacterized protein LOC110445672 [Mizuhopecten yessoensis]|uniref:FAST kinase domain-containing protein 5 n=1 Tax=Mizuhopecten yessoensis TaxID=6573 RepID=A0A210QZF5_MIZYE|nr:uncharacterized protein LOC110445672 [Mizuhopecten yessoensis]XP_021346082.1 uncharacterized protein LOC110445672 [Mizuhopecten yessoensis]OWF54092.1 hypothetical protein KP79_PYT15224 [Mizuhopecten yessoensis]